MWSTLLYAKSLHFWEIRQNKIYSLLFDTARLANINPFGFSWQRSDFFGLSKDVKKSQNFLNSASKYCIYININIKRTSIQTKTQ